MNNEKYNQIIDEAYENYSKEYEKDNSVGLTMLVQRVDGKSMHRKPNVEMFVTMCKHDKTFSEKWGLKIEERELSLEERLWLFINRNNGSHPEDIETMDDYDIPTKIITLTYNNETIEIYE